MGQIALRSRVTAASAHRSRRGSVDGRRHRAGGARHHGACRCTLMDAANSRNPRPPRRAGLRPPASFTSAAIATRPSTRRAWRRRERVMARVTATHTGTAQAGRLYAVDDMPWLGNVVGLSLRLVLIPSRTEPFQGNKV